MIGDLFDPLMTADERARLRAKYSKHVVQANQRLRKALADEQRCTICAGTAYYPVPEGDKRCGCWDASWGIKF